MLVVGLMSGTSMDGVDAAVVELSRRGGRLHLRQLAFSSSRYPARLRDDLMHIAVGGGTTALDLADVSQRVAKCFATAAKKAVVDGGLDMSGVDAIASHGQTVGHLPGKPTLTVQVGEPAVIAEQTGVTTVADFRLADTAAGGQGAPLASFAHRELFAHPRVKRAIQNIGGIGNVTMMAGDAVCGTDTGPGNMLIDGCVTILSGGRRRFDKDGVMASKGRVHERLVSDVLAHPFFRRRLPASTGREDFGETLATRLVRTGRKLKLDDASIVASATMATARSIARCYGRLGGPSPGQCFVCGGGALNRVLVSMLADELPGTEVATTVELGVDPTTVEAVAFAVLGFCTLEGKPSNVPEVTGARGRRVLGKIAPANNFKRVVVG